MPTITFIEFGGSKHIVEAESGKSIMQTATDHLISGIVGDCGGALSCATCHAYIDAPWGDQLPAVTSEEEAMIECALDPAPSSRLTCQITVSEALDGLVVRLPKSQF